MIEAGPGRGMDLRPGGGRWGSRQVANTNDERWHGRREEEERPERCLEAGAMEEMGRLPTVHVPEPRSGNGESHRVPSRSGGPAYGDQELDRAAFERQGRACPGAKGLDGKGIEEWEGGPAAGRVPTDRLCEAP